MMHINYEIDANLILSLFLSLYFCHCNTIIPVFWTKSFGIIFDSSLFLRIMSNLLASLFVTAYVKLPWSSK